MAYIYSGEEPLKNEESLELGLILEKFQRTATIDRIAAARGKLRRNVGKVPSKSVYALSSRKKKFAISSC